MRQQANVSEVDAQSYLISYLQMTEGSVRLARKSEAGAPGARRTLLARLTG